MATAPYIVVFGIAYLMVGAGFACVMFRTGIGRRLSGFFGLDTDDVDDMFIAIAAWPMWMVALVVCMIGALVVAIVMLVASPAYFTAILLSRLFDRMDRRRIQRAITDKGK